MFVDTHAHLFYENFEKDVDAVVLNAKAAGVSGILVPGTDIKTSEQAIEIAGKYDGIYAAAGVHPTDSKDWEMSWKDKIKNLAGNKKVVAIGEIGLDYYWDFSPKEQQIKALRAQLELALELNLPAIIHNRDANEDIMSILREYRKTCLKVQMHCFAGSAEDAYELAEMGHYLSFTGNITYKKADKLNEIVKSVSIENLLLETDCPFMTPVPHRGSRNEPAYIKYNAQRIAEIHNTTIEDVARTTSYNAFRLFGIGKKPELSYTYQLGNSLYINVTNRCNANCFFCDRKGEAVLSGYNLKMQKSEEPEAEVYIKEIGDPKKYKEVVFCGYGEPTIRWETVKTVAEFVKKNGGKTRMNTNGHGNFINKRDITPELAGLIDTVSISLNSVNPEQYAEIMRVKPELHAEMINFAKKAKDFTRVVLTIVGIKEVDKAEAKHFVTEEIGVEFRERGYF